MTLRELTVAERSLLDFLLTKPSAGQEALMRQAETVRTGGSSCACGCPSFSLLADRSLPAADVPQRVASQAHGLDPGGNRVGVLLFADDGYLREVEIFGYTGSTFVGLPDPSDLCISEWSDSGRSRHLLNP